jgi:uncharacterized protein YuzE
METLKIAERPTNVNWDYDDQGDVLYISIGQPSAAEGIDLGEGVIARIDATSEEMVGVTILGLKSRLLSGLGDPRVTRS